MIFFFLFVTLTSRLISFVSNAVFTSLKSNFKQMCYSLISGKRKSWIAFFLTRTNINPLSEAMRRVVAARLTRLAQKIAALRHPVAESRTTCRLRSYRRQFGNFLTGLYTLRDAVRTFIHALRTFSSTLRQVVIKAKGGFRQKMHRAIKHMFNVFTNFYNNCQGLDISKQKQRCAVTPHLQNLWTDVITVCSGDSDTD